MASTHSSVLTRDDTFFGVCEALGEDFGFNPFYLRLALGVGLIWYPLAMIATYAALGLLIAAVRFIAPDPRFVPTVEPKGASVEAAIAPGEASKHSALRPLPAATA
jgi:phage shock protein PspC (stress-responsive transcriptional regulator)